MDNNKTPLPLIIIIMDKGVKVKAKGMDYKEDFMDFQMDKAVEVMD